MKIEGEMRNNLGTGKRGQITIFVIVGIVIVLGIIIFCPLPASPAFDKRCGLLYDGIVIILSYIAYSIYGI